MGGAITFLSPATTPMMVGRPPMWHAGCQWLSFTFLCGHHNRPLYWYCQFPWAPVYLSKADVRKIDALDQSCLRRILDICWYHRVSNWEVRRLTEQPLLTSIIQKRRLMLFGHLIRMDESADARRILDCSSPE